MKTLLITVSVALAGMSSAQAQVFRPSVGNGAVVGAVAGGLIGGHNGDRWAEGAVIGGVAGALIGAALTPQQPVYQTQPAVVYQTPASYGQQVYSSIPNAQIVPAAPVYEQQQLQIVPQQQVVQQPQVVYVESAPQVIYAPAPRVIYEPAPVVSFNYGYSSGPRYYGGYRGPSYYAPSYRGSSHHGPSYYGHGHGHSYGHR